MTATLCPLCHQAPAIMAQRACSYCATKFGGLDHQTEPPTAILPAPDSHFWQSPALKFRSPKYPATYRGRVPMRIRMAQMVRPDPLVLLVHPESRSIEAHNNGIYEVWTNSYGAIAAILPDGKTLGIKPLEADIIEWYLPEGSVEAVGVPPLGGISSPQSVPLQRDVSTNEVSQQALAPPQPAVPADI